MPMTSPKYRFGGIFRNVVVSDGISGTFCAFALFCAKAGTAHSKPTATKQHVRNRLIAASFLEQILHTELHLPRDRVARARDAAKPGAPEVVVGKAEICRVEQVVNFGSKLQFLSAAQRQILEDREVDLTLLGTVHQCWPDVAGLKLRCRRHGVG